MGVPQLDDEMSCRETGLCRFPLHTNDFHGVGETLAVDGRERGVIDLRTILDQSLSGFR